MTTSTSLVYRHSELVPGYELPQLNIVPILLNANPGSAEHYQQMGFRGQPMWGPNLWGDTARVFRNYFGSSWLASGQLNIEFKKPMYPDETLVINARVISRTDEGVEFEVWIQNGEDQRSAGGNAAFSFVDSVPQPSLPDYVVPMEFKNTASWERGALPVDIPCTPIAHVVGDEMQKESLATTDEVEDGIYAKLVHPRLFLAESFKLKTERPSGEAPQAQRRGGIHVGSEVTSYAPAPLGREYRWFGTYIDAFETSNGNQWGRKEVIVLDEHDQVVFKTINKFIFNPAVFRTNDEGDKA